MKISRDFSVGVLHPRENIFITGNINTNGGEIIIDCDGSSTFSLDLRGTFNGTMEVQGTVDGNNWTVIPLRPINLASIVYVAAVNGTATGVWSGKSAGYRRLRARCTAYTSGTFVTTIMVSTGLLDDSIQGNVTPNLITAVGATGAAVTLTIPAPGAGLRQYVTYIAINRFAAATLTGAAAPVTVTTTNLPGSMAFSLPADAALIGTMFPYREDFAWALASSAQNVATTIVAPTVTNVIWRISAGWYVAP